VRRALLPPLCLLALLVGVAGACSVDPYCFVASDAAVADGASGGCTPGAAELCNGLDDDCDGETDEGFGLESDPENCGRCGVRCDLGHGLAACEAGRCVLRRCLPGAADLDGDPRNGCEAACGGAPAAVSPRCPGPDCCDGVDTDCDGQTDEDHDTSSDPDNCGGCAAACESSPCAFVCTAPFAATACRDGRCVVESCTAGHVDLDLVAQTGCEYACTPSPASDGQDETTPCNGRDDDCDGTIDEAFLGQGEPCPDPCRGGTLECVAGRLECAAAQSEPEECNGLDDDCDGEIDEDVEGAGEPCGSSPDGCSRGTRACEAGELACREAESPLGQPCGPRAGECTPGVWACEQGRVVCSLGREACDGLDDDCDGAADEGIPLGESCGPLLDIESSGLLACIGGVPDVCIGYRPAAAEVCDGADNDGDGSYDEDASCPAGSACIDGRCLLACSATGPEPTCPVGMTCTARGCVGDLCSEVECARCERCDPSNGLCVDTCAGLACPAGLVCRCGRCWPPTCGVLGCASGQVCRGGACVADPCADAGCAPDQGCASGICTDVCRPAMCGARQRCEAGRCVDDPCATVDCPVGECDPRTGECSSACVGVFCPPGTACDLADGACEDDPCATVTCPGGSSCQAGSCVADEPHADGGVDADAADGGPADAYTCLAGTGGCGCRTTAARAAAPGSTVAAMLSILAVHARRRRRVR